MHHGEVRDRPEARAGGAPSAGALIRVLHVDPDDTADRFREYLGREHERVEAVAAARANDALDRLDEEDVDCLVTAYHLDDVDGVELLRIVRETRPELPVILFTTEDSEAVAADALDAGVTDYLRKGTRPDEYAFLTKRVRDAVALRRAERERDDLRRRYDLVADVSADAFWEWDIGADEVQRDQGYVSTFGYESSEVGSDLDWWYEAIHPDDRDRLRNAIDRALADPDAEYDETYRLRMGDGSYGYVRSRGDVIYDEEGEPDRMIGAHIDITDRKAYERRLEQRNERLDEFASVVSHDLRNPLNVVSGALELARETGDTEYLDRCQRAVERMDALIDDLLVLAREGEAVGDTETVDLRTLVEDCWETVETHDATLRVDTDRVVRCDPGRVRQLLENLIRNAVEHGGPNVTVTVGDVEDGTGFYVADDGPGVPADEREQVFESGYSTSRDGTGFGLAIVERVATAHGWEVRFVESDAGGARIEVLGA